MNAHKILSSSAYWQINKHIARKCGIYGALLLADLLSKREWFIENDCVSEGDWFFNTVENIKLDTTLSKYQQNEALKNLKAAGFIYTKYADVPKKRYYLIDDKKLLETLTESQRAKNLPTRSQKTLPQEVKKLDANNNKELRINNNNTHSDFDEVWALYPKKKDRVRAKRYYEAKVREPERSDIKASVIIYAQERKGKEKDQYTITGGNFFCNERWREYVPTKEEKEEVVRHDELLSEFDGYDKEIVTKLWNQVPHYKEEARLNYVRTGLKAYTNNDK